MAASIPPWLTRHVPHLKKTGNLALAGERFDPADLGRPRVAALLSICRSLDLSHTPIASLACLPPLPRLLAFSADYSRLETFTNFRALHTATSISLKGTPLAGKPSYRPSVLLAAGGRALVVLDGAQVGDGVRRRAAAFPAVCAALLNAGWTAGAQPPQPAELGELCARFGLRAEVRAPALPHEAGKPEEPGAPPPFDELLARLVAQHEAVLRAGALMFGLPDVDA
jgi:hypothetical protein